MNKSDITSVLQRGSPTIGFITKSEFRRVYDCSQETAEEIFCKLDYITTGRAKKYLIKDVTQKLWDLRIMG